MGGTDVLVFFVSPVSTGEEGERAAPCLQTTRAPRDGRWSFDDIRVGRSVPMVLLEWFP